MIESLNNILKLMLNTGKKLKFVLQSALFFIFLVLLSTRVLPLNWVQAGILFVGVIAITTLVLHFPNIKIKTLAPATIKTPSKDNREPYIIFLLASISIMFLLIVAILSAIIINGKRKRRIRSMRRYRY